LARRSAAPAGGFTSARREIVGGCASARVRTCSRTACRRSIAATTLRALDLIESGDELRARLRDNTAHFRTRMTTAGFTIVPGEHPIAP
jgi:glycine C-acetyltransferase